MIAGGFRSMIVASFCGIACALGIGAAAAQGAGGSFQFGPVGEEAGQISGPKGMAVNSENGGIYVSDTYNERIDEFDRSGNFLRAWGWGVVPPAEGDPKTKEFQICTDATGCDAGLYGAGAGQFDSQNAAGIAVDNDPSSGSHGDVYVVDDGNYRVEKFDSEGKFLLMLGGHVNQTTGGDVCVSGEACEAGTQGTGDGEFNWAFQTANIAVGPEGEVYVGDQARVEVFEPSGVWKENILLSALSSEGKVTALAVSSAGDVFVKDEGVPGVHELEPPLYVESLAKFDEDSEAVRALALDAAGNLFISEDNAHSGEPCACDLLEYSPSGQELESFGEHALIGMTSAMSYDTALGELLVYGSDESTSEYGHEGVWGFPVPPPGPLVEPQGGGAMPELRGAATLEALVNPEGAATEVKFEYVAEKSFRESGYAGATSTPVEVIGSSFEDQHVVAHLSQQALTPGVAYHWRVVAHNSKGADAGAGQSFEETPPAEIEGPWAAQVTTTSATLSARIDPLGANTSYRLEYGTTASYGHVRAGDLGEGVGYLPVSYHLQELQPATTYHYRVVSESEVGTIEGADHTFITQPMNVELALPDGRAWELVSPAHKGGALIENTERSQAASDGSGIVYTASEPIGEGVASHVGNSIDALSGATVLSKRGAGGWQTRDISPTETPLPEGLTAEFLPSSAEAFETFTSRRGSWNRALPSDMPRSRRKRAKPHSTYATISAKHTSRSSTRQMCLPGQNGFPATMAQIGNRCLSRRRLLISAIYCSPTGLR